jgi:hypothetical protein
MIPGIPTPTAAPEPGMSPFEVGFETDYLSLGDEEFYTGLTTPPLTS